MCPIMSVFDTDLWAIRTPDELIEVDCLLPTGVIVILTVNKDITLSDLKDTLWPEIQKYPLYDRMKAKNEYMFACVNESALKEEINDESRRLCDVRPFQPILQIIKKPLNVGEKIHALKMRTLIGKELKDIATSRSEVSDFRENMKIISKAISKERNEKFTKDWLQQVNYLHPPAVVTSDQQQDRRDVYNLGSGRLCVNVWFSDTTRFRGIQQKKIDVPVAARPSEAIDLILVKVDNDARFNPEEFLLRVQGRYEYLLGDHELPKYKYIRDCMMKGKEPDLQLLHKEHILPDRAPELPPRRPLTAGGRPAVPRRPPRSQIPSMSVPPTPPSPYRNTTRSSAACSWDITKSYRMKILKATNVDTEDMSKIYLRIGLYHGGERLCKLYMTQAVDLVDNCAIFNEEVQFDIPIQDVPRMARVCFSLIEEQKYRSGARKKNKKQEANQLAWVNIPVYDYHGNLRTDQNTLFMWPITDVDVVGEDLVNPIGTVECNPQTRSSTALTFTFHKYNNADVIYYPPFDTVIMTAAECLKIRGLDMKCTQEELKKHITSELSAKAVNLNTVMQDQLCMIIDRDPLTQIELQDQQKLWNMKYECCYYFPYSLPKILTCIQWNKHDQVAQMLALLLCWPELPPTEALELLDFRYADNTVRHFAVQCLEKFTDTELCQYLLQLVQVLKYENYLDCDLVQFLLRRAINNQRLGHYLFWLLRSEMHVPSVSVRFGLILEAYFHGAEEHMQSLLNQSGALTKFSDVSKLLQGEQYRDLTRTKRAAVLKLRHTLEQYSVVNSFNNLQNTLDPALHMRALKIPSCKFFESKMRPLRLLWENLSEYGADIPLIYKRGDDLRQDMLILQILSIMDSIWRTEKLDLRLNLYGCLSTGAKEGIIELVTECNTLANIQKDDAHFKLYSAFNKKCLYNWLEKKNPGGPLVMEPVLEEFKRSCAGCCVATYVLGIADRHSDNIMLKSNGQLFHIDFGHILGNFKTKFGVKRERVPFVLTSEMVYLLKDKGSFSEFKKLCEDAYLALRRKANFFIRLFLMMTNTGIPELSRPEQLDYLKETLAPHLSEKKALLHFRSKFTESLSSSWKTSVNFAIHNMAKENT